MADVLAITGPIFILIGIGFLAVRAGVIAAETLPGMGRFVLHFCLPALIFSTVSGMDFETLIEPAYLTVYGAASLLMLLGGVAFVSMIQRPMRLIGLVDDASAELLTATARRLGARMSWLARHSADRHQVHHSAIEGNTSQLDATSHQWALQLGRQLAGTRKPNSINLAQSPRLEGRFVSFVIEV